MTDHYALLGVTRSASADTIKQAFRRAASVAHPDREGGDAERMKTLNEAYRTLMDREARARYDASLNAVAIIQAPPVSAENYAEAGALAPWLVNNLCGFCDGAREVRVQSHGFWERKPCPVCSREGS